MDLSELKTQLEEAFPQYQFSLGKRITGPCLIARKNRFSGADVFIKPSGIIIEAGIPEFKTRLLVGAGAVWLKARRHDFHEPAQSIYQYLLEKGQQVRLRN